MCIIEMPYLCRLAQLPNAIFAGLYSGLSEPLQMQFTNISTALSVLYLRISILRGNLNWSRLTAEAHAVTTFS
jgi:hypothetical protein